MEHLKRRKNARMTPQEPAFQEITRIPATLYFPPDVLGQLNELCELRRLSPGRLIAEAFKSQYARWDEFCEEIMTPLAPGEREVWSEDPLYALACVAMLHFVRTFIKMVDDPDAFEEFKKSAPAEWPFSSVEEQNEPDEADWWKSME
jgi:hypothetical protein